MTQDWYAANNNAEQQWREDYNPRARQYAKPAMTPDELQAIRDAEIWECFTLQSVVSNWMLARCLARKGGQIRTLDGKPFPLPEWDAAAEAWMERARGMEAEVPASARCFKCESAATIPCDGCNLLLCERCYLSHLDRLSRCPSDWAVEEERVAYVEAKAGEKAYAS